MSVTDETPGQKRPPRAEPLQPDQPGSGDQTEKTPDDGGDVAAEKQKKQSSDALDNVREGYE